VLLNLLAHCRRQIDGAENTPALMRSGQGCQNRLR